MRQGIVQRTLAAGILMSALGFWACAGSTPSSPEKREKDSRSVEQIPAADRVDRAPEPTSPQSMPPNVGPQVRGSGVLTAGTDLAAGTYLDVPELGGLRIVNGAAYDAMYFQHYGVNPTIDTEEESTSTFSIDVDTASYTLNRSYLERGSLAPEASVRVEEFINAFSYDYEPPRQGPFSLHAEAFPSPHRPGYHLLHLGIRGRDVLRNQRKPAQLVFVIDVSGSMAREDRLGLVKRSLRLLVDELSPSDRIGVVVYGSDARVMLELTSGAERGRILAAIDALQPEGSTNAQAGIAQGYQMLERGYREGYVHRVILCSDGVANNGIATSAEGIFESVRNYARSGIEISTVGFGMGNYNDVLMEKLAQLGDGNYTYVDRIEQARRIFVEELTSTLQVIAKDVKVQVVFDSRVVARFRLLGYENRHLEQEDFDDDRIDAGEVGAGHSVTALYEIKFRGGVDDLGMLRLRYKDPEGGASRLLERRLGASIVRPDLARASAPARLSLAASAFAEKLRGSYWVRSVSYDAILGHLDALPRSVSAREPVQELRALVARAAALDTRGDRFASDTPIADMDFDRVPILEQ